MAKETMPWFNGLSEIYAQTRPATPPEMVQLVLRYLGRAPGTVIDLGCGPGTSTTIWCACAGQVIGLDCNEEMLSVAKQSFASPNLQFLLGDALQTGPPAESADVVVCSQSFHWMEPTAALREIHRLLAPGGVFAAIDYDWPPVPDWQVERSFLELTALAARLEAASGAPERVRWDKNHHLTDIRDSGLFRYAREVVFDDREPCTAQRLYAMALSQTGVRAALTYDPDTMGAALAAYRALIEERLGEQFEVRFCYRMRMGIK